MPSTKAKLAAGVVTAAVATGATYLDRRHGLSRDIKHIREDRQYVQLMGQRIKELGNNVSIYHMIELADQNASALWFEGRTWTYAELRMDVDKFAAILEHHGVSAGDNVAVFMTNSPEMIIAYVALAKLGAIPAMVNSSLRSLTLEHCLEIASAEIIICTPDIASAVVTIYEDPSESASCIALNLLSFPPLRFDSSDRHTDRITQIRYEDFASASPSLTPLPCVSLSDTGVLMYTSGTTGKPKAVNLKHFVLVAVSTPHPRDINNKSLYYPLRMYSCMPLFHASSLYVGFYSTIGNGGTFCLGRKFSAGTFTQELVASRATRMLYVGELCRYVLRSPESIYDKAHSVIVATGNGLAKDVWEKFKERFGVPEIREFYRSTEGKAKFDIMSRSSAAAGSVGFQGLIRRYYEGDTYLVKYDPVTEAPYRDPETGFCIKTKADEPGEAIGRILSMDFYAEYLNNPSANNEKLMTNVFAKGDVFQRTGDILIRDRKGWIRFLDRTGDTYRWRGENVSAGEVREHIARIPGVTDVAVFGIKLEGYDGQAGAAGISLSDTSHRSLTNFITNLYPSLKASGLTTYQIPRLIRITDQLDTNATFKHAKEIMKSRPWDPNPSVQQQHNSSNDTLYWLNLNSEAFEKLDEATWAEIKSARARL